MNELMKRRYELLSVVENTEFSISYDEVEDLQVGNGLTQLFG